MHAGIARVWHLVDRSVCGALRGERRSPLTCAAASSLADIATTAFFELRRRSASEVDVAAHWFATSAKTTINMEPADIFICGDRERVRGGK